KEFPQVAGVVCGRLPAPEARRICGECRVCGLTLADMGPGEGRKPPRSNDHAPGTALRTPQERCFRAPVTLHRGCQVVRCAWRPARRAHVMALTSPSAEVNGIALGGQYGSTVNWRMRSTAGGAR